MDDKNLTLTCRAVGKPRPEVNLHVRYRSSGPSEVFQGQVSKTFVFDDEEERRITKDIQCGDTGSYSCHVKNGIGELKSDTIFIIVSCEYYNNIWTIVLILTIHYVNSDYFSENGV